MFWMGQDLSSAWLSLVAISGLDLVGSVPSGTQRPLQFSLPDLHRDGLGHIRCLLYTPAGFSQSPFQPCFRLVSLGSCDLSDVLVLLMGGAGPRHPLPYLRSALGPTHCMSALLGRSRPNCVDKEGDA